jgi:photosystem II stability/assembly factor-like uncharacterized protein
VRLEPILIGKGGGISLETSSVGTRQGKIEFAASRTRDVAPLALALALLVGCSPVASLQPSVTPVTYERADLAAARVSRAGAMVAGGFWARRENALYTSVDGSAWKRWPGELPIRPGALGRSLVVWDEERAWVVESANSVASTTNGGADWKSATFPGDCIEWAGLTFSSVDDGALVCWNENPPSGRVATTHDGGATWSLAQASAGTGSGWIGPDVAAGPNDLWSAAVSQENGTQSQLAHSGDGGKTWSDVSIPGLDRQYHGGGSVEPLGAPLVDGSTIVFAIAQSTGESTWKRRIWHSADAGDTWGRIELDGGSRRSPVSFLPTGGWFAEGIRPGELNVSNDAGKNWTALVTDGLPDGIRWGMAFTTEAQGMLLVGTSPDIGDSWIVMFVTQDRGQHWVPARIDPA